MKIDLQRGVLWAAGFAALAAAALFGGSPVAPDLRLIDRLNESVQHRFQDPKPTSLGMSRAVSPSSFGEHFRPDMTAQTDFTPENPAEFGAIAALEEDQTQVGLYLFGAAITDSEAALLKFRALKGPGAITRGTPRPAWYPTLAKPAGPTPGALPDWNAIYPLAQKAMKSFQDGGKGFETTLDNWNIAARPVVASQARCVSCHNNPAYASKREVKLNEAIGGVLYAFRRVRNPAAANAHNSCDRSVAPVACHRIRGVYSGCSRSNMSFFYSCSFVA